MGVRLIGSPMPWIHGTGSTIERETNKINQIFELIGFITVNMNNCETSAKNHNDESIHKLSKMYDKLG